MFRYRDPQLQVGKNDMYNLNQNICEFSKFIVKIPDSLKYGGEIKKKLKTAPNVITGLPLILLSKYI